MERSVTRKALDAAPILFAVRDKYGTRWVKVNADEWLSSELTFSSTKMLHPRRVVALSS